MDSLDFKRRVASLESPVESAEIKIDPMPSKSQKIERAEGWQKWDAQKAYLDLFNDTDPDMKFQVQDWSVLQFFLLFF